MRARTKRTVPFRFTGGARGPGPSFSLAALFLSIAILFSLAGCGEVEYPDACKDSASAADCNACCESMGYVDWTYNPNYSPPCGCIH